MYRKAVVCSSERAECNQKTWPIQEGKNLGSSDCGYKKYFRKNLASHSSVALKSLGDVAKDQPKHFWFGGKLKDYCPLQDEKWRTQ